jgi:hypothetical protein
MTIIRAMESFLPAALLNSPFDGRVLDGRLFSRSQPMDVEPLEVYARDSNYAIVKPPGRRFPGAVIQGDTLRELCRLAISVGQRVRDRSAQDEEFLGDLEDLVNALVNRLLHYQKVLVAHGIEFPYSEPVTVKDLVRLLPETDNRT